MKIWDCFTFFDELMLLEIRLKELSPAVDKFVLVEATHTHSGKPKPLYYNETKDSEVLAPFKDKIVHIIYKEPMQPNRFANDRNQRNAISLGLASAEPDDVIIVTDIDEIVSSKVVPILDKVLEPTHLVMKLFYYYFNCRANQKWTYPAACRFKDLTTADALRLGKHSHSLLYAGWHFSYLIPSEEIPKKLEAFAHAEFDTDYHKDKDRLRKCVDANKDIFDRPNMKFTIEPLDAPRCVMDNEDRYKQFIK